VRTCIAEEEEEKKKKKKKEKKEEEEEEEAGVANVPSFLHLLRSSSVRCGSARSRLHVSAPAAVALRETECRCCTW
jgi:hypothetical protein